MFSLNSAPPTPQTTHPQTPLTPCPNQFFWRQILCYTGNAIFVVIALAILDWLYNATPGVLKLDLGTSNEPSVFSVAVEDSCLVNGIFAVCLPDAGRHR